MADQPNGGEDETDVSMIVYRSSRPASARRNSSAPKSPLRARSAFTQVALLLIAVSLLSSCGTVTRVEQWFRRDSKGPIVAERPVVPPQPTASPPKPKLPAREPVKPEKPEKVASVDPDSLIGMEPAAIEKLLGSPTRVSKSDISLVWTYAGAGCAFQIFFYPDLKSSAFHALKYGGIDENGVQVLTTQGCVRDILAVKSSAPG